MSDTVVGPDDIGWEHSEELDQIQPGDSLEDRGVDDVLDEGYSPVEKYRGEGWGTTAEEAKRGETFQVRWAQEDHTDEVDVDFVGDPFDDSDEDGTREVGNRRAGRLVGDERADADVFGNDVGIDGGAACAEEAAVHIIDDEE